MHNLRNYICLIYEYVRKQRYRGRKQGNLVRIHIHIRLNFNWESGELRIEIYIILFKISVKACFFSIIQGCQRVAEDWQRIIQVRSLVVSPSEDMNTWLKYASLCRKNGRLVSINCKLIYFHVWFIFKDIFWKNHHKNLILQCKLQ